MERRGFSREMLYTPNAVTEAYFKPDCLAVKELEPADEAPCVRQMTAEELESEGMSVVVQNVGGREASEYKLVITFSHASVQVLDVQTESLELDMFYSQSEERVSLGVKILNPAEAIRNKYKSIGLPGSYVSLVGGLAAGTFEMFRLAIGLVILVLPV
jgi:hypothetical protein